MTMKIAEKLKITKTLFNLMIHMSTHILSFMAAPQVNLDSAPYRDLDLPSCIVIKKKDMQSSEASRGHLYKNSLSQHMKSFEI